MLKCAGYKLYRYVVFINGRKAIYEALVNHSVDFADRPEFYSHSIDNKDAKGNLLINYKREMYVLAHLNLSTAAALYICIFYAYYL